MGMMRKHRFDRLESEVREGKFTLVIFGDGEVERLVVVVAVRLKRGDEILARLGVWSDKQAKPGCTLPGGKRLEGELPNVACERVVDGELSFLAECGLEIEGTELEITL